MENLTQKKLKERKFYRSAVHGFFGGLQKKKRRGVRSFLSRIAMGERHGSIIYEIQKNDFHFLRVGACDFGARGQRIFSYSGFAYNLGRPSTGLFYAAPAPAGKTNGRELRLF